MSKGKRGLQEFRFLPEHEELGKGFFVRTRGGKYHLQWRDPITRKMRSRVAGTTYTEVIDLVRHIAVRTVIGSPVMSGTTKVWELIELFFEREVAPPGKKKPKTRQTYTYNTERFILPALGELRVSDMTTPLLNEFLDRIDEFDTADPARKRNTAVTVNQKNQVIKILKALFRWAYDQGYVLANPAGPLRQITPEPKEHNILTPQEFEILLGHVNDYYRAHLIVLYWSSMRVGELGAISWKDVSFREDGRVDLHIRQGLSLRQLDTPKTPKSRRTITLPAFIAEELRAHQERQAATHEPHPAGLAFTTATGKTLDTGRFRDRVLYRSLDRANKALAEQELPPLPRVTVHELRHSSITAYRDHGSDLMATAVQLHAGHTNLRTTDRYTHLDQKRRESMADLIEQMHKAQGDEAEECREDSPEYGRSESKTNEEVLASQRHGGDRHGREMLADQAKQWEEKDAA